MKLCCINITTEESSQAFLPVLRRDLDLARDERSHVEIRSIAPGLERALDVNSSYFSLLNKVSIVDEVVAAEANGADAALVLCFLDPAVAEAREIVDIPVVGIGEASLFFACQMGRKFAVVTLNEPKMLVEIERSIDFHGVAGRAARNPVVPIDIPSREWLTRGMSEPSWVAAEIARKSRQCVSEGAEVIIVGCVGLAPLATLGGLTQLEDVGVPIIDCVQVGLKLAELRAAMGQSRGWPAISRAGMYAKPRERDIARVRRTFGVSPR